MKKYRIITLLAIALLAISVYYFKQYYDKKARQKEYQKFLDKNATAIKNIENTYYYKAKKMQYEYQR